MTELCRREDPDKAPLYPGRSLMRHLPTWAIVVVALGLVGLITLALILIRPRHRGGLPLAWRSRKFRRSNTDDH